MEDVTGQPRPTRDIEAALACISSVRRRVPKKHRPESAGVLYHPMLPAERQRRALEAIPDWWKGGLVFFRRPTARAQK